MLYEVITTAATAAAARVGAPFMLDFAVISLSDLLQDWDVILKRLEAAASADFAVALYNPKGVLVRGKVVVGGAQDPRLA